MGYGDGAIGEEEGLRRTSSVLSWGVSPSTQTGAMGLGPGCWQEDGFSITVAYGPTAWNVPEPARIKEDRFQDQDLGGSKAPEPEEA